MAERRPRGPLPWLIGALLALILLAIVLGTLRRADGGLSERTPGTGAALTREQQSVRFERARLALEVFPDARAIDGRATLDFAVIAPIERIQFDLDPGLPIREIRLDGKPLDKGRWRNPDGQASVELGRRFAAGERFALDVEYGGKPHVAERAPWDGGFVWSKTKDGKPWVATAVQGEGCDLFWPCFDNSLVEIGTVDLAVTVPKGLVAPANGRLIKVTTGKDGRPTYHWRAKSPNNYAIALNVAPYREVEGTYRSRFGNTFPIHYWYVDGRDAEAKALFAEYAPTLDFFEARIGPYPFGDEKAGAVETPHLGMEHQTINAYGNGYKRSPDGFDWLFHHEFAHEWFGNQLTNRNWDDMWLHEGFGTYMQPLYAEWRSGRMAYDAWLWKIRPTLMNRFALVSGKPRLGHVVYDKETGPGLDIYNKGAWVLHTLRGQIGDEAFFRSVRRMVYGRPDPRPGNFAPRFGTTDEFVAIVNQEAGRDLTWFFKAYLRQAKLPRLVQRRSGQRVDLKWRTPNGIAFPMPVEVAIDGKVVAVPMTSGRGSVTFPTANSQLTIDPQSKLLRQSDDMERFAAWDAADKAKQAAKK